VLPPLGSKLRRWRITLSRHRHRVLLLAICCSIWITGAAQAALILTSIKTASPLPAGAAGTISGVINEQVKKLLDKDSNVAHIARQVLIDESDAGGASADFQTQYVNSLIQAVTPLMGQGKEIQHNVAVIIGGVAAKVEKNDVADLFTPQVKTMVQSKDVLVAYWGMKTAHYALQSTAIKTGKDGGLGKIIVDAVEKSGNAPVLIEEGYLGLTFDGLPNAPPGNPRTQGALAGVALSFVLDLLEWRVSQYNANTPPGNPQADTIATRYLPYTAWPAVSGNRQTQDRTLKAVGDLAQGQLNTLKGSKDAELLDAVQRTGDSINAFGSQLNDLALQNAGKQFKSVTPATDEGKIDELIGKLNTALQPNIHVAKP
jgi:hypothetical protein